MTKSPPAVANQHSLGIKGSAKDENTVNSSTKPLGMLRDVETKAVIDDSCKKSICIIPTSEFVRNENNGSDLAILRSLRAAGVKFMRYTIVDAYNNIRCKAVPVSHTLSMIPTKSQKIGNSISSYMSPLDNPVSIAEVCFAGLPSYSDELISTSKLDAQNVLILQPDLSTLRVLPYAPQTAMIMCTAHNQQTKELSPLCTRGLLERVMYVAREELGVEFCVGAELEFMLYRADSKGVPKPVDFAMFANSLTLNEQEEFIGVLFEQLQQQDISVDMIHAESAPSQLEVVLTYSSCPLQLGDDVILAKETISACAKTFGMKALFLPKTSKCHAGNGLHLHFSFRDRNSQSNENAFSDHTRQHGISAKGASFLEGILHHLPSLLSFSLPTVNSFRRMGPGCWTGHNAEWAIEHKEVPLRVCLDLNTGLATHVEFKLSDACANIYLELAMILSAGMEGMKREKTLRPKSGDAGVSNHETNTASEPLPRSLQQSLDLLKDDEFLISVMGPAMSTAYIAVREAEINHTINKTLEEEVAEAFRKA